MIIMKICDYVNEGDGVQHATMKERVRKGTILILNCEFSSADKITAINTLR